MYGEWRDDESSKTSASEIKDIMDELRGFRPYLRRRLQYIRDSNRSMELQEEVTDIEYYLSIMIDSEADLIHGMEQLRGFVHKLHEMAFKKPIPKGFKYKKEDENSGSTSNMDDNSSQEGGEHDVAVGDLEKRLKRGKQYQDWRITENIKSLRDPETDSQEPEPAWLTFYKSEHENEPGNEAPPSTSEVIPSEEQQHISQPVVATPDWLQETTDDHLDPLVAAGLEAICERRVKKVDVKPILKNPCLRQNPLFRPPQPGGPSPVQYQPPQVPAPHPRISQAPGPYHQGPQAYAPSPYLPVFNQPVTNTPSWMLDDPCISYQPTSYDYSRSAPPGALLRQPPIASTYVAGYGHISIMPPLQSNPPPPLQPRIQYQSEYQVPRDVRPNPFFNPRFQHPPAMSGQQNHLSSDLHAEQRGSSFKQAYPMTPAPNAPSFSESSHWDNDDNESSMSYGSYKKAQMQQKRVQFQRNAPPKNRRYFHKEQAETKRGGVSNANQQRQTQRFNYTNRKSTVRQILEKGQQKVYKLGQHEKIAEEVEEDDLRPSSPSERSPQRRDSSPSPPQSPEENNDLATIVKLALSKIKNKKELDRLLKDESALKALLQGNAETNPPSKQANKKTKAKKDVPLVKKAKQAQQKRKKEAVADTSKESPSKGFSGFSSESECGSVVSSMSTRSATRKRANPEKSSDSETSCPGTSRSKLPRNMAVKSGSVKGKGNNANFTNIAKKSPSPQRIRKRVVKPLASDSENEEDEENASAEDPSTKPAEKTIKRKPSSALIEECIAEFVIEQAQKKKKETTEAGPNYWHQKKIVNEKGGQLIRKNDILVNQRLNKIDLGHEYAEAGADGVKVEIKLEDKHTDEFEGMEEGDHELNFDGNQMTDPECEVIDEIGEFNVGDIPESVVEVLMEASDCENDGGCEDKELDVSEPAENDDGSEDKELGISEPAENSAET